MNWLYSILIGTIFFIVGQLFLRRTFESKNKIDYFTVSLLFSSAVGIFSLFLLLSQMYRKRITINENYWNPIFAGLMFFIGFFFWIYTISSKKSLGLIRIAMAGFETIILFLLSYIFFNDIITVKHLIGSILVLLGIGISTL